jgi:hypothetical protein
MRREDRASNLWEQQPSVETPKYHGHKQVYGLEMGVGREAMSVMCDIFNMPPPPLAIIKLGFMLLHCM